MGIINPHKQYFPAVFYSLNIIFRLDLCDCIFTGLSHFQFQYDCADPRLVHIVIVQLAEVIGKPLVFHSQQPEKGGFPGSLTAHQTEHDFKFAAGMKCPVDGSQQEQPQGFIGVLVAVGS